MRKTGLVLLTAACLGLGAVAFVFAAENAPVTLLAPAATAAEPAPAWTGDGISISLDELKTLLARKETPRVAVANIYHGSVTGRAVALDSKTGTLDIDVSAEGVGVDGILGVRTTTIVSIKVLVPLTQEQIDEAKAASAAYIAGIRTQAAPESAEAGATTATMAPSTGTISATDSMAAPAEGEPRLSMLEKYPPKDGWGPKRLAEIARKAVVLHLEAAGKEKTFLKDYDAWKNEYNQERARQLQAMEAFKGMGEPVPEGFEVWPALEAVPALEGQPSPAPDAPVGNEADQQPSGMPSEPSGQ